MNQTICNFKREATSISLMYRKDDEKLLSESLFRNLHVLQRFYGATPKFKNIYEPHMFIKPNPKAFLHVFHFIFNCLDSAEFARRFQWPIYGKVNETWFRNCTLDYINRLNTIHQLGLGTLKLHNIYIPGGLKFIKIVHKLSFLAMNLTLKKHTKSIPNVNDIPDPNDHVAKLEDVFDYIARLQVQTKILRERTDEMNKAMLSFFQKSTVNITKDQCWNCLADQWRNQLDHVIENDVKPQLHRVATVSSICCDLKEHLKELIVDRKENIIEYDKSKLVVAQNVLMKWNPDRQKAIVGIIQNNSINFENLLQVFNLVLPNIIEKIETLEFRKMSAFEFESGQIDCLDARASQVQNQLLDFEKDIQPFLKTNKERFRKFCSNLPNVPFNIMLTPIVTRQIDTKRQRFSSMDGNSGRIQLFNDTIPLKARTYHKKHQTLNNTIAARWFTMRSNKVRNDALQILLEKKISKGNASGNSTLSFSNKSRFNRICSPKFSSAISSTAIKNNENKYHRNELQMSPMFPSVQLTGKMSINVVENSTFLSPHHRTAVTQFSINLVDQTNVRQSPTRRWEIDDSIVDVQQYLNNPSAVKNVMATLNEEEFLENISDCILSNVSN